MLPSPTQAKFSCNSWEIFYIFPYGGIHAAFGESCNGPATTMAVTLLVLSVLLGVIWRQHRTQKRMTQQFLEMMQHRYHA
jgi:hypothetical protein